MLRQRCFTPRDLGDVMAIATGNLRDVYAPEFFLNVSSLWREGFLVIEDKGRVVAFIMGVITEAQQSRILLLAIDARYRRKRLGTMLLQEYIKNSGKRGVKALSLEVRTKNRAAIKFYQRFGFEIASTIESYYNDGESGYLMWRSL